MGWTPPRRLWCARVVVLVTTEQDASVSEVSAIGLDLAKRVFQAHGADGLREAVCKATEERYHGRRGNLRGSAEADDAFCLFRARDLLVRQRTQAITALHGHLGEYGVVAAKGPSHVAKLIAHVEFADQPVTSRPGSGLRHRNTPAAASKSSVRPRKWASERCGAC
jgi:hypothetical protein